MCAESSLAWLLSLMTLQKLYADEVLKPAARCMPFAREAIEKTAHSYQESGSACTFQNSAAINASGFFPT